MKIAHVTFSYLPIRGGADAYLDDLRRILQKAGHEQLVIQCAAVPKPGVKIERDVSMQDCRVVQVPLPPQLSPGRRFWLLAAALPLYRNLLAEMDRLVVHYPVYCLSVSWHPAVIGLSHGVTWDGGPMSLTNRIKRGIARKAFHKVARFVANDSFFLREMGLNLPPKIEKNSSWGVEFGAAPAVPFSQVMPGRWYLPNCVDTNHFAPSKNSSEGLSEILVPRNLYRNRGVHLAVSAFVRMGHQLPESRMLIAGGSGDRGYRKELEELVKNSSLQQRVVFLGPVQRSEMRELYRRSALTMVTSVAGEGTSLAALESMACRTPVVATRVGGLVDLPCALCDVDAKSIAETALKVLTRRSEIADLQRSIVEKQFNISLWADAWLRVVS
ncbi:MAG: glycosyltransferase family 4 protein [Armatimonadota bacterium]